MSIVLVIVVLNFKGHFHFSQTAVFQNLVELPWCSGSVMDCHATAPGSIPSRDGVFTELHVLRKGQ